MAEPTSLSAWGPLLEDISSLSEFGAKPLKDFELKVNDLSWILKSC